MFLLSLAIEKNKLYILKQEQLKKNLLIVIFICLQTYVLGQQNLFEGYEYLFTTPLSYMAPYTKQAPNIDGDINDEVWQNVPWTDLFQDIEGNQKPQPYYETRAKIIWDDERLYVAAELKDSHVWAKLTERDQIVFFDNDFEIFLNPNNSTHQYFEIEINALNTIFDLYLNKPYREGAGALFSWDSQGIQHATKVLGSINNPSDIDEGWTVEFAIPWRALTIGNDVHVPKPNEIWRLNFSRVQWDTHIENGQYVKDKDEKGNNKPENNWVWSAQGVVDMHLPERWGYLQFVKTENNESIPQFVLPYSEQMRSYLWLIYYKQKKYNEEHGSYAQSLQILDIPQQVIIDGEINKLQMEATHSLFEARIENDTTKPITITNEGLIK